jgi:hypothetical protein
MDIQIAGPERYLIRGTHLASSDASYFLRRSPLRLAPSSRVSHLMFAFRHTVLIVVGQR